MPEPKSTTTDLILAPAINYAIAAISAIPEAALSRSSPCPAWTVGDVLVHLLESLECVTTAMNFGVVAPLTPGAARSPTTAQSLLCELPSIGRSLIAASRRDRTRLTVSIGHMTLAREYLLLVGATEATIHGWDAAHGAGQLLSIPEDLAERLISALPKIINDQTRDGSFSEPISVPADAPPAARLLAALGRQPYHEGAVPA